MWRKTENENGIPYYVKESTNERQWDHPKFADIKQRIDECNNIKYGNYRVASKIMVLQRALYMEEVALTVIAGVFERHRLGVNESSLCLENVDLEAVLTDIYFAANKQSHTNTDIDFATELMLNFLYNVYDKERTGKIQVSSTKLLLSLLSNCQLPDLYHFIFNLCADHNNCVTRLRLRGVLTKLAKVTTFMHEDVSYGQHLVNCAIEECFSSSPGLVGVTENSFTIWLESGPQILSWIPTMFRIKHSELVAHPVRCSMCRTHPIVGLRYKCVKCSRYNQCQNCFMLGRTSGSHKLTHSMKEYCSQEPTRDFTRSLIKKFCSVIMCSVRTNVSSISEIRPVREKICVRKRSVAETEEDLKPLSSPQIQLQVVIRQLELQNSELQQMLSMSNRNDKEMRHYLEEHRQHVDAQIKKLKVLKEYLKASQPSMTTQTQPTNTFESTPMIPNGKQSRMDLNLFSPITPIPECSFTTEKPDTQTKIRDETDSNPSYSLGDLSTWFGGKPSDSGGSTGPRKLPARGHSDLDDALAKLQQILANNFTLDESLGNGDNGQLKSAVTEVEGMLSSFIDSVESSRANSVPPGSLRLNSHCDLIAN